MKQPSTTPQISLVPSVEHYSSTILDDNTLIVTGHFVEPNEGGPGNCGFATMKITLSRPLSGLDKEFMAAPGNEEFAPADLGEFYGIVDDATHREILLSQGLDPDETFARWAAADDGECVVFAGRWIPIRERAPDPATPLLVHFKNGQVERGVWWPTQGWQLPESAPHGIQIMHWTPMPDAPSSI